MVTLRLDNLSARYGRTDILSGITTGDLTGGQLVALLGPNASGKSTLFKRMLGHLKGAGTVHLSGGRGHTPESRKPAICYMPQDSGASAALTVYEAVLLARMQGRRLRVADEDLAKVDEALTLVSIASLSSRTIGDLSGGQRQLVGAAQAIVQDPDILLLDEPTSALDLHRQIEFFSVLRRLANERAMLIMIAMHDLTHALRFTDQAIIIKDGRLLVSGRTAEILTSDLLRAVYRVQARIEPCRRGYLQVIIDDVA